MYTTKQMAGVTEVQITGHAAGVKIEATTPKQKLIVGVPPGHDRRVFHRGKTAALAAWIEHRSLVVVTQDIGQMIASTLSLELPSVGQDFPPEASYDYWDHATRMFAAFSSGIPECPADLELPLDEDRMLATEAITAKYTGSGEKIEFRVAISGVAPMFLSFGAKSKHRHCHFYGEQNPGYSLSGWWDENVAMLVVHCWVGNRSSVWSVSPRESWDVTPVTHDGNNLITARGPAIGIASAATNDE